MKYLDALFVAMYRRLPHDMPRIVAILALAVSCNQLTGLLLLGRVAGFALPELVFLLLPAANAAWLVHRYRPSRRAWLLARPGLPAAAPWQAAAYLVISLLLFLAVATLLRPFGAAVVQTIAGRPACLFTGPPYAGSS